VPGKWQALNKYELTELGWVLCVCMCVVVTVALVVLEFELRTLCLVV
jgi:hypothetical protein